MAKCIRHKMRYLLGIHNPAICSKTQKARYPAHCNLVVTQDAKGLLLRGSYDLVARAHQNGSLSENLIFSNPAFVNR